jgi:hypothetical protein
MPPIFLLNLKNKSYLNKGQLMEISMAHLPGWVIVMDYVLGLIMWTLIGRVAMNIFLPIQSNFFFMRVFVKYTNPIINIFGPVTPKFLVEPLIPLYVAWFFYLFRFYFMPWALGYSVMGMLSFPLEGEITQILMLLFSKQN